MRKILSTAVLCLCFIFAANAQEQAIKVNPLGLAFGNFNATYEKVLNDKSSVLISANYQYQLLGVDVNSFGLGLGWRYYITNKKKPVPAGFHVTPQIGANFGSVDDFNYNTYVIGAEIGYQWVWDSGFLLDLGIGPGFYFFSGDYEDVGFDTDGSSFIGPIGTLAIGYAW